MLAGSFPFRLYAMLIRFAGNKGDTGPGGGHKVQG